MKALLEHNGFTKMVEVSDHPREVLEVHVPPSVAVTAAYYKYTTPETVMQTHKYWIFRLATIHRVDGENVAIYQFMDER